MLEEMWKFVFFGLFFISKVTVLATSVGLQGKIFAKHNRNTPHVLEFQFVVVCCCFGSFANDK